MQVRLDKSESGQMHLQEGDEEDLIIV